jgi:hypothetical protein
MKNSRRVLDWVWKLVVTGLAFTIVLFAAGALLTAAGLHAPAMPPGADSPKATLISFALAPLLALGVAPLAAGLAGSYRARWLSLAFLGFITLGVNTAIETVLFTHMLDQGGMPFFLLMFAAASIALGLVAAKLFGPAGAEPNPAQGFAPLGVFSWAWRVVAAVLAFPIIYFIFGLMVAPFVVPIYRTGVLGLTIPPFSVLVPVELVRSALSLLGVAGVVYLWAGSRRGLVLTLGWATAVTVGLYGLVGAFWMPTVLRVAHSLEITADSFCYALVIVLLLKKGAGPRRSAEQGAGLAEPSRAA